MDKTCEKKPERPNATEIVRIICMIVDEAIRLILALRGWR